MSTRKSGFLHFRYRFRSADLRVRPSRVEPALVDVRAVRLGRENDRTADHDRPDHPGPRHVRHANRDGHAQLMFENSVLADDGDLVDLGWQRCGSLPESPWSVRDEDCWSFFRTVPNFTLARQASRSSAAEIIGR